MDKIKTVKIKNQDGTVSEESYSISVDATNVDMSNGKDLQDTIGNINIDEDGSVSSQLNNKINISDIIDNLNTEQSDKPLSAKQGYELNVKLNKKPYYYNTVADMKNAKLKEGDMAITLGYYEVDDGGAGEYKIRTLDNNNISDEMFLIKINNSQILAAELIIKNNTVNLKQLGSRNNGIDIDTQYIKRALEVSENKKLTIIIPSGVTLVNETLSIPGNTSIIGENNAKIKATSTYSVINNYKCIFKNKNSVMHTNIDENIYFENITLESTDENNGYDGLIHFRGVKNSSISNCNFIINGNNSWGIILFSANKNIIINNVNVNNISQDNSLGGCLWVRGGFAYVNDGTKSYGIHITNSNFASTAKDECVVIADGINGSWVEAQMDNCNIYGNAETNLPNFLLVENAIGENSYLKVNCTNINIVGKCSAYAMVLGYSTTPTTNTDLINSNINITVTGGGIRSYSPNYIISNANIKCTDYASYSATIINSYMNKTSQSSRLYNCTIITDTGNGADNCPIVKNCYIDAKNNGIKNFGLGQVEWINNHIVAETGNGIYAQNNGSEGLINSIISGNYITRKIANNNTGLAGINIPYAKATALVNNRIIGVSGNLSGNYAGFNYSVIKTNANITETENNASYITS